MQEKTSDLIIENQENYQTSKNLVKNDDGFAQYLREIQKFPILTPEQEYEYAVRFARNNDKEAGKILIQSHLRLVVKIAYKFKNYATTTHGM